MPVKHHGSMEASHPLPNACDHASHVGPRCTDNTRDMGDSSVVWCGLQEKVYNIQHTGTKGPKQLSVGDARERRALSVTPVLPGAIVKENDRVIFVSAKPSHATFM